MQFPQIVGFPQFVCWNHQTNEAVWFEEDESRHAEPASDWTQSYNQSVA